MRVPRKKEKDYIIIGPISFCLYIYFIITRYDDEMKNDLTMGVCVCVCTSGNLEII